MSHELDLLVTPLGCTVLTGDQSASVEAPEVAVDERVPRLRLIGRALGETEEPLRVVIPGVRLEVGILVVRPRLHRPPFAVQDVLAGIDELPGRATAARFTA